MKDRVFVRTSSASILKHTRRDWDKWIQILEDAGARTWTYKELIDFLHKKYRLKIWWLHIVAQGFETAIGKRVEGRNSKGLYTVTVTGTVPLSPKALWGWLTSTEGAALWLNPLSEVRFKVKETYEAEGGVFGEIRTMKVPERMRLRWQETEWDRASTLQLYLAPRPGSKTMLVFMHEGLANARLKEQMRSHWRDAINHIKQAATSRSLRPGRPKQLKGKRPS